MESFVFLGFSLQAWITLVTVFVMFTVLLFTKLRSDVVFLCAVGVLYLTGVLQWIVKNLLGTPKTYAKAVLRLMLPVAALSSFLSNTTVVALFVNIVKMWSKKLGYEPYPFLIALMIAVSSSFATPIGSPTHMLVYGPGGYRFADFLRIGLIMNLIILAANILIVNLVYPLTPLAQ